MWTLTSARGTTFSLVLFPSRRRQAIVINFLAGLMLAATLFRQANAAEYFLDQARIQYDWPANPAHMSVYKELNQARALENIQKMLPSVRLPQPLLLKLQSCGGDDDAWYDNGIVTVCYGFLEEMLAVRPKLSPPLNLKRQETLIAFATNTFLHEIGHAIFSLLKVPVLGREEDAADAFAAYISLQNGNSNARKLILGYAYQYKVAQQSEEGEPLLERLADEHGMAAQRFYNLLCLAYGADQRLFSDLVDKGLLPKDRAEGCDGEYEQAAFAFHWLLGPHVDDALVGRNSTTSDTK